MLGKYVEVNPKWLHQDLNSDKVNPKWLHQDLNSDKVNPKWLHQDLNLGPLPHESSALSTELCSRDILN